MSPSRSHFLRFLRGHRPHAPGLPQAWPSFHFNSNHKEMLLMTHHAQVRSRQRAIPSLLIDLLLQFGASERAPGGACKLFFDKSARRRLQAYAGPLASMLQEHLDLYAVVAADSRIVTVGHRLERIRRH